MICLANQSRNAKSGRWIILGFQMMSSNRMDYSHTLKMLFQRVILFVWRSPKQIVQTRFCTMYIPTIREARPRDDFNRQLYRSRGCAEGARRELKALTYGYGRCWGSTWPSTRDWCFCGPPILDIDSLWKMISRDFSNPYDSRVPGFW